MTPGSSSDRRFSISPSGVTNRLSQLRGAEELLTDRNMPFVAARAWAVGGMIFGWMEPGFCRAL